MATITTLSLFLPSPQKLQSFSLFTPLQKFTTPKLPPCPSYSNNFTSFLTTQEVKTLNYLQTYTYSKKLPLGFLTIRVVNDFEVDMVVELLAESFSETMMFFNDSSNNSVYVKLLGYLVKQYLVERRGLLPHCVSLIGYFRDGDGENGGGDDVGVLSGTVEVSFNKKGANASPPTPVPPKDCAYICNMTVKKEFRRRGIGWHLLKASEELISNLSSSRDVYLHCRMIDTAPFNMYQKAGYEVVKTDSFLVLLTLQRRKHLMRKELPVLRQPLETVIIEGEDEVPSLMAESESEPLLFDEVIQNVPDMDK